jgi:DNA repair exonuclease SbcCD ATPase subunit
MSIMIREYLGYDKFDVEYNYSDTTHLQEGLTAEDPISPNSLMVDIEGIHVGPTRNFTRYMESALKSSERSWTRPYEKPLIMHHNEKDGKIIGRVKAVHYTDINTRSGTGALVFTTNVPDKDGMEQVQDGRLTTVSIGIIGHDVRCSICGHNIAEAGPCEHERGQIYGGEICYWDIYEMEGKELSYVIVPSDIYAKNIRIYKPTVKKAQITENLQIHKGVSTLNLTEAEVKQLQDDKQNLETQLKEAQDELKTTQDELKAAKEEVQTLKDAAPSESEVELKHQEEKKELEDKLKEAQGKLQEAQDKLKEIEGELTQEKSLRESLESKSIEQNTATKQALAENYSMLRKLAGKPDMAMEKIQERTQDSLIDAIRDLKEELGESINIATIKPVANPTITESTDPIVKKDKKASNIDLEEGLQSLFSGIAGNFSNK